MATHSSILAWRIPGTEGPGELLSMGLQRVEAARSILFQQYVACYVPALFQIAFHCCNHLAFIFCMKTLRGCHKNYLDKVSCPSLTCHLSD